ncbi:nitroreductase [Noviherbaspirillum sp. CPCC 100848]|uniref:Nitroreductase n=1 Tax=Noviherbaspirillum album TaxID=3080276 RepID=A0ABU6J2F3_9BURK|nr:nitroreductase [Noviherbaspirillum sp. CPCC 100848]MEC4717811.1 nitroreductase [Noviherbaspirillum sp. CPCC 100848]
MSEAEREADRQADRVATANETLEIIAGRRSVRAFLPKPVEPATIAAILETASRAPSGTNTQPWKVYVVTGDTQRRVIERLVQAFDDPDKSTKYQEEYPYYPREWVAPYIDRRRKVGWDLYTLLGIGRADKARMHAQHRRNVEFFGAPVSLFFTIDRIMQQGSWLDYGMFLQNVMLAARAHGLETCPQAAINEFHPILREMLGWPDNEMMVCSMSLGVEDMSDISGRLVTEREPVAGFARFFT